MSVARSKESSESAKEQCTCEHCGTRFQPVEKDDRFCCSGCEYVYRIIQDESLDRFYELRGTVSRPVGASVFRSEDFNWLKPLVTVAEEGVKTARLTLALEGVSCVGCVWLVDHLFDRLEGGVSCRVNVQYGTLDLEWKAGAFDVVSFARRLKEFGYRVCPAREAGESESKQVVWKLGLAGAFALNGMLYTLPAYLGMDTDFILAPHFNWLSALFASLSLVFCGSYFVGRAVRAALHRVAHLDLPISIGIVFAYLISWYGMYRNDASLVYFDFVCTFVFLMLVGRWLQVMAVERNRNRLADILLEAPEVEIESATGGRIKSKADQLREGDFYWLGSGQRVPVLSRVLSGRASLGMDWISGETESRVVEEGGEAPSGAALENQFSVRMEALERWDASLLSQLTNRSTQSMERDAVAQRWIFRYLLVAFAAAVLGGIGWWYWGGDLGLGLKVFISVLVVSCPCALGIAWPFADEIALARLKREGVFVTTHSLWNRLSRVKQIVFDKTGTLTRASLTLLNASELDGLGEGELIAVSALCGKSRHPVSTTIRTALMAKGLFRKNEFQADESVGQGTETILDGIRWRLGKADWACPECGVAGTCLSKDGKQVLALKFDDQPLADSYREVETLAGRGYRLRILSGDLRSKAERIGAMLGFSPDEVVGEVDPEGKATWLKRNGGEASMMVGDGANDTLAFDVALCSGAPANEQGIVAERADFHYLGNGIRGIRRVLEMGRVRRRTVVGLVGFALVYNVFAVGLSLAGLVTPLVAAILMPLSSIGSLALVWGMMSGRKDD